MPGEKKDRVIWINGEAVPVTEEVYKAFMAPIWREKKRRERVLKNPEKQIEMVSLDAMLEDGCDIPASGSVEDMVEEKILLEFLRKALLELADEELDLIEAIYYNERSERDVSKKGGKSNVTVNTRHRKAVEKLRKLLNS